MSSTVLFLSMSLDGFIACKAPECARVERLASSRQLAAGLWHWTAPNPDWRPSEPWDRMVSSQAIDDGARLLLFAPIAPPHEIEELAADRGTAIVLTAPWHERDAQSLVERLGLPCTCRCPTPPSI